MPPILYRRMSEGNRRSTRIRYPRKGWFRSSGCRCLAFIISRRNGFCFVQPNKGVQGLVWHIGVIGQRQGSQRSTLKDPEFSDNILLKTFRLSGLKPQRDFIDGWRRTIQGWVWWIGVIGRRQGNQRSTLKEPKFSDNIELTVLSIYLRFQWDLIEDWRRITLDFIQASAVADAWKLANNY